ncbi:YjbF family lipoprotein [Vibrio nigripulchritudo]|uniref:YjbF family lipoprotein n=1 Tax=Vibrio nigripulchritudo TaxID=28173 RepID=UPI0024934FFC|nr:YjbF family lipoprotein [Vibrio nigripulchritudo]BDU38880.1 WbfD protein [Vibrio nigripulchritudo]BDU44600.1 WbfD protein [Vibrio nigripulchritudo]
MQFGPLKILIFAALIILASGCTQKMTDVGSSLSEAFTASDDVTLSSDEISELPYASTYVRINDGKQVFMVLAFVDLNPQTGNTQLKWVSADSSIIVTEKGRIVKTNGFDSDNLMQLSGSGLNNGLSSQGQWNAVYDWSPDYRYLFEATVSSKLVASETLTTSQWTLETKKIEEKVSFKAFSSNFTNLFWVANDGKVMKSIQYIGPDMNKFEMTILKTFAPNE